MTEVRNTKQSHITLQLGVQGKTKTETLGCLGRKGLHQLSGCIFISVFSFRFQFPFPAFPYAQTKWWRFILSLITPLTPVVYLWLLILCIVQKNAHRLGISGKGGTKGCAWDHLQGAVHMAAARLDCKVTQVGTRWVYSCPGCMNVFRKCYSQLVYRGFISSREGCLDSELLFASLECRLLHTH